VVNELLIVKGRSLDKITQAETIASYPGLSRDLGKLTASQYLGELLLYLSLSEQPQGEFYTLLNEHLQRLENLPSDNDAQSLFALLAHLAHSIFHLLVVAGLGPRVQTCGITNLPLIPNFSLNDWQVGFSIEAGGIINLASGQQLLVNSKLDAEELLLLQQLPTPRLSSQIINSSAWAKIERVLRDYAQYHCGRAIRSAALVDTLSAPLLSKY
ncbi:MAG: DNA repair protein RecO, partial [Okeania sp. SIO2D1]|nr:DNA repair protein RecO [Okeania sp. SIO2D1]